MAELATIARPYAEALFKSSQGRPECCCRPGSIRWLLWLAMRSCCSLPATPRSQTSRCLTWFRWRGQDGLARRPHKNFLRIVIENGRLSALPEIASQFRAVNARSGSSDAVVYSAFPIDGAALADVSAMLEKRFGRKLNVSVAIDADLIGGIRVVVGDEVLDTSVKARLEQMKTALTA
jgi:F-type H+-transporting ATPase subunit delta